MPRKKASQELTRDMIVNEARKQFERKDFHQVSMRSIAQELDCSHGAIYYHFKNKAELFYTIIEEYFISLNERMEDTVNGPGDKHGKLKNVFLCFIEFGLDHQSQYEIMFMTRNKEVDGLSHEAANLSYQKFAETVQSLSHKRLLIKDIYSAFISLHGFVSHYSGSVSSYKEAIDAAQVHADFILKAFD